MPRYSSSSLAALQHCGLKNNAKKHTTCPFVINPGLSSTRCELEKFVKKKGVVGELDHNISSQNYSGFWLPFCKKL